MTSEIKRLFQYVPNKANIALFLFDGSGFEPLALDEIWWIACALASNSVNANRTNFHQAKFFSNCFVFGDFSRGRRRRKYSKIWYTVPVEIALSNEMMKLFWFINQPTHGFAGFLYLQRKIKRLRFNIADKRKIPAQVNEPTKFFLELFWVIFTA